MGFTENKKEDIGTKFAAGILSTDDINTTWFGEKYGLSPNQLPSDIWMDPVPEAEDVTEAIAVAGHADYPQVTRHTTIKLKQVSGTNDTLYLAVDDNGDRMRNFINPNNHQLLNPSDNNRIGEASTGYMLKLFQNHGDDTKGTAISLGVGEWTFYYKEGAMVFSTTTKPNTTMGWNTGPTSDTLFLEAYQYTGATLLTSNTPTNGYVLSYTTTTTPNSLQWISNAGGGTIDKK